MEEHLIFGKVYQEEPAVYFTNQFLQMYSTMKALFLRHQLLAKMNLF
jgi:hypothetical protein